jgi:Fe-S-cluster-containing dehydrogenase component/anaerobic selenocysteine-containing dehydrogenase
MKRRDFLRLVAATGVGTAAGCTSQQSEELLPYLEQPEEMVPGKSVYFATTNLDTPEGAGVLVRTREGRALKLEGNPANPLTKGKLNAIGQASVQGLYNPDRLTKPLLKQEDGTHKEISWPEAMEMLKEFIKEPVNTAFLNGNVSDSDNDLLDLFCRELGYEEPLNLRLYSENALFNAAQKLFGSSSMPEYYFENASLVVSLNADFLETWGSPISQTVGYTQMHSYANEKEGRSIYIGSRQSNTAASCDKFIPLKPGFECAALRVIAESALRAIEQADPTEFALANAVLSSYPLNDATDILPAELVEELESVGKLIARQEAPLVITSGHGKNAELAQMLALLITHVSGGAGKTLSLPVDGRAPRGDELYKVITLCNSFGNGEFNTLVVHEANPAFQLPGIDEKMINGQNLVYLGTQYDETAKAARLVLPIHHFLESWGDFTSAKGVTGILQPVMKPIFGSKAFADILISLARDAGKVMPWQNSREYAEWRFAGIVNPETGTANAKALRELKRAGGLFKERTPEGATIRGAAMLPEHGKADYSTLLANFFPHQHLYDGRGADKSWLQEVPETSTSAVWGSWLEVHPDTAAELNVTKGDALKLKLGDKTITLPVLPTIQAIPGVLSAPIGQGHTAMGRYAEKRGVNPLPLLKLDLSRTSLVFAGIPVEATRLPGAGKQLITLAGSQDQGEREIARAITVPKDPHAEDKHHHHIDLDSTFYPETEYDLYDWGMVIDLDKCTGCGACSAACYAENNLGVVGEQWAREGREMAWIRIEKYADGDDVRMMPNLCQHCHDAPCEPVCPVQAAYHSPEGLNVQVYNRCVGTRYCSNNCPYKVRRFNWFDYEYPSPLHLQMNPDISVRERGVMEKCTFCVQRIKEQQEIAKNEGRIVEDGEVQTACQQTCPADAISFGNLEDENSQVSKMGKDKRAYRLLEELGTRPSITYLKKVIRKDI